MVCHVLFFTRQQPSSELTCLFWVRSAESRGCGGQTSNTHKLSSGYPRLVTPNNRKHTQRGADQAVEWRPGIFKTWVTDTSQAIAASHWPHWLLSGYATSICFFLWVVSDKCWTVCLLAAEKRNKKWGRSRKNKEHLPAAWFSSLRLAINTSCVPLEGTQFFLIILFFPIIVYLSEKLCTEVFSSRCTKKMSVKLHVCIEIILQHVNQQFFYRLLFHLAYFQFLWKQTSSAV